MSVKTALKEIVGKIGSLGSASRVSKEGYVYEKRHDHGLPLVVIYEATQVDDPITGNTYICQGDRVTSTYVGDDELGKPIMFSEGIASPIKMAIETGELL